MKKSLRTVFLLAFSVVLLTVSALADTGPKPLLTVKLENAPTELYYYLELLEEGVLDYPPESEYGELFYSYSEEELEVLFDHELLMALHAAVPEGWHACTVEGTNGAPMWGDIRGEDAGEYRLHTFGYHGVPDEYRILIVCKSGEVWLSPETYTRETLQSSVTVDFARGTVTVPSAARSYVLQSLGMLLPTLLIEGALLALFGYRTKKSWLTFLAVNLVTQGGFAVYLALTVLRHGVSGWSLLFYIPIEGLILLVELLAYARFLREHPRRRALLYAAAANIASATIGLALVAPLWKWIVSIS